MVTEEAPGPAAEPQRSPPSLRLALHPEIITGIEQLQTCIPIISTEEPPSQPAADLWLALHLEATQAMQNMETGRHACVRARGKQVGYSIWKKIKEAEG
eukprot:scaffold31790_cov20-Tisochrysis_lutea.AAC.1